MTVRINMWSSPRNLSTAMMYSWRQRHDTTVVDEPLYAHYLHVSGRRHPGSEQVLAAQDTSGAAVIACLTNIGPGLGDVGPTDNFAGLPALGKVVLSLCMLFGRLEVFTVLVVFFPAFWRK